MEQRLPANDSKQRPRGVWIISGLFVSLAALGLYEAFYQFFNDPFPGHGWGMWARGVGPYVVADLLFILVSAAGVFTAQRWGRIGLLAALFVAFCGTAHDAYQWYTFVRDDHPDDLHSLSAWLHVGSFSFVLLVMFVSSAGYLFGHKTREYFL